MCNALQLKSLQPAPETRENAMTEVELNEIYANVSSTSDFNIPPPSPLPNNRPFAKNFGGYNNDRINNLHREEKSVNMENANRGSLKASVARDAVPAFNGTGNLYRRSI